LFTLFSASSSAFISFIQASSSFHFKIVFAFSKSFFVKILLFEFVQPEKSIIEVE
jgi:hypothetical protein